MQRSDGSDELGPEIAFTVSSFSLACQREVRAGEASTQNVDRLDLGPVDLGHIAVERQARPLRGQNRAAGLVYFDLPDDLAQPEQLQRQVQTTER